MSDSSDIFMSQKSTGEDIKLIGLDWGSRDLGYMLLKGISLVATPADFERLSKLLINLTLDLKDGSSYSYKFIQSIKLRSETANAHRMFDVLIHVWRIQDPNYSLDLEAFMNFDLSKSESFSFLCPIRDFKIEDRLLPIAGVVNENNRIYNIEIDKKIKKPYIYISLSHQSALALSVILNYFISTSSDSFRLEQDSYNGGVSRRSYEIGFIKRESFEARCLLDDEM